MQQNISKKEKSRLDIYLFKNGMARSRTHGQYLIAEGKVKVNNTLAADSSVKVSSHDDVVVDGGHIYVSRGAYKLLGAIKHVEDNLHNLNIKDKKCLDVGCSTGGFTQVLLEAGAREVVSIDVGTDQFDKELLVKYSDGGRLRMYESKDIRDFELEESESKFDIIVGDVSFISLDKIIDKLNSFLDSSGTLLFLLKPQFEVGKGNTDKGIVKDDKLIGDVIDKYKKLLADYGYRRVEIFDSSIRGGDGNRELFIYANN